ncbi:rev protein [Simian immunodeficiency virus]|uniref:Protein Rev n=1 Tax=Simian immunodeficiency virus TaxID=11723 RepID=E1ANU3_SIV|nr:rev protein [Simian immunodeficiency virus]
MLLGEEDQEIRRRLRLINFLLQSNPYPQPGGTANQRRRRRRLWRRRWLQIAQLAERIFLLPDTPPDRDLIEGAVEQLQQLAISDLPEPPVNPFSNPADSAVDNS